MSAINRYSCGYNNPSDLVKVDDVVRLVKKAPREYSYSLAEKGVMEPVISDILDGLLGEGEEGTDYKIDAVDTQPCGDCPSCDEGVGEDFCDDPVAVD